MNKKGLMNFPLGFIGFFILLLVLVSLLPFYYAEETFDLEKTIQSLDWENSNSSKNFKEGSDNLIVDVTYKFVDFVGYSAFEVAKGAIKFGISRPDLVNPVVLLWLVTIALVAPILIFLFKFIVIAVILIKEFIQSRREKRLILKQEEMAYANKVLKESEETNDNLD